MQSLFDSGSASCMRCGARIAPDDINVTADTALCRSCGAACRFSELVHNGGAIEFDPACPPPGVSVEELPGGFRINASTRSWQALFLVPFMVVWSGGSLRGIHRTQMRTGRVDLLQWFFVLPALVVGTIALMYTCGNVVVMRDRDEGCVFEGIGPLGWTRRFRWNDLASIAEADASWGRRRGGPPNRLISLSFQEGRRSSLKFGTLLDEENRRYLISVLRSRLAK